ncbi:hypothetical protein NDU88_001800 [Pleurodeles waltl]|uniref:Uncharacterized protein n=1 Tax=Pleurodeles waltl TaxID=8319 RepID=A0AAV7VAQ2_PLEWA|nr:hypothetical protein NDU88_001800 [Pleurodeles waltl]
MAAPTPEANGTKGAAEGAMHSRAGDTKESPEEPPTPPPTTKERAQPLHKAHTMKQSNNLPYQQDHDPTGTRRAQNPTSGEKRDTNGSTQARAGTHKRRPKQWEQSPRPMQDHVNRSSRLHPKAPATRTRNTTLAEVGHTAKPQRGMSRGCGEYEQQTREYAVTVRTTKKQPTQHTEGKGPKRPQDPKSTTGSTR